jgi:hypothetical protein
MESGDPIAKVPPGGSTGPENRDPRNWAHDAIPKANSWYMGANVNGKQVKMLQYFAGIPLSLIVQRVSHAPPSTVIMSNV